MYTYDPQKHGILEPLWPNALVSRGLAAVAALMVLAGLAFFWPELLMPSDRPPAENMGGLPMILPWYLWPVAGLNKIFPPGLALALVLAGGLALLFLPFWDKAPKDYFWGRYVYSRLVLCWLLFTFFLAFWGLLS
jgi:quinol-cytochrome oxidoreductase complex cytochrome b subunit